MRNTTEISIESIIIDRQYQGRAATDAAVVGHYFEAMEHGDTFPPLEVYEVNFDYFLIDGFHRLEAYRRFGAKSVDAYVTEGTADQAMVAALTANQSHGLQLSNADKRLLVKRASAHPSFQELSDRELAKKLRVSPPFVAKIKHDLLNPIEANRSRSPDKQRQVKTFSPPVCMEQVSETTKLSIEDEEITNIPGPDYYDEHKEMMEELIKENEKMHDRLAASHLCPTEEEQQAALEHMQTLREDCRLLQIEVRSLRISRDAYMSESSQKQRQINYWEREANKATAALAKHTQAVV